MKTFVGLADRARLALAEPVDVASLAMFRIAFGLVILWEAIRYLWPSSGLNWVQQFYAQTTWNFPYHGFEWIRPLPEPLMTVAFVVFGLSGLCVALGFCYRTSAAILALSTTYIFLLEATKYLNHFYLMCLLAFLLAVMPAAKGWSIDSWLRRRRGGTDAGLPGTVPFWPVFLLRAQLFIVYFYGGIAKLNADWFTGSPLWALGTRVQAAVTGVVPATMLPKWFTYENIAQGLALGGLAFDLGIGFLLIWRRTRFLAIALCAMFHGFNSQAFSIGVFPLLAFAGTLIFCEPDWPRRAWSWLRRPRMRRPDWAWLTAGTLVVPLLGALVGWRAGKASPVAPAARRRLGGLAWTFMVAWTAAHLLLPLRHYAIPGDANWTEEGHRFSWRMMLRSKEGYVQLAVFDPALFVTDANAAPHINWAEWTRKYPKILHSDIDATKIPWDKLPELVVLFEPLVGERIVINHRSAQRRLSQDVVGGVEAQWLATYGRRPRIVPSVSLVEALNAIHRRADQAAPVGSPQAKVDFLRRLQAVRDAAATAPSKRQRAELHAITLNNSLEILLDDDEYGAVVHDELARTHPFSLQGRQHSGLPFMAVEDPELQTLNRFHRWQLDRAKWKHTEEVYLDLSRIRHEGWVNLPRVLVYHQDGQPRLEWNCHADLIPRQIKQMGQQPYMIHQYAQRVADLWEADFGRRPQVVAATSLVAINHRPPQNIIDPTVDLAAAPIKLFGHNDWIVPLKPEEATGRTKPDPSVPATDGDSLERPRYADARQAPSTATAWYSNGQKYSEMQTEVRDGELRGTMSMWYEDGRLSKRAEYVNGRQHGPATSWFRNGRLATHVHYRFGKRHGEAKTWYENGPQSWEGEFRDGQLQGIATGWSGD